MIRRIVRGCASILMAVSLSAPLLHARAGDVHVVGAGAGSFGTIQAAVDVAQEGDVILVKPGTYPFFRVEGKGISIVGDGPTRPIVVGGAHVRGTATGSHVLLSRLELQGVKGRHALDAPAYPVYSGALEIADTSGSVRIEECHLLGAKGAPCGASCPDLSARGAEGLIVTRARDVSLRDCSVRGGDGTGNTLSHTNGGGDGLRARASNVALYNCAVQGGLGGNFGVPPPQSWDGGHGGHGIVGEDAPTGSTLVQLTRGSAVGGFGGFGDTGGDGGDGVRMIGVAGGAGCSVQVLGCVLVAGLGGTGLFGPAPDGLPLRLLGTASALSFAGAARHAQLPSPVRSGNPMVWTSQGQPGDTVYLLAGQVPGFLPFPAGSGVLQMAPGTFSTLLQGVVPASGVLTFSTSAPVLPPGEEAERFFFQASFTDPGGTRWLAAPLTPVVLDPSF